MLGAVRGRQVDVVMATRLDCLSRSLLDFYELHRAPGERRELLHEIIDEVRVYPDRVEVALYDGTHASAPLEQAARKVRGPGGGGGKSPAVVHAVHGEVHAPAKEREPSPGTQGAVGATVKLAQRVEWLPLVDLNHRPPD